MQNNIVPFTAPVQARAAEKEKTLNALRYRMALSVLLRLREDREITPRELEQGRVFLARRFGQESV